MALLAIRGRESWCGGLGVILTARRQGLGRQMMVTLIHEARALGVALMRLECIDGNLAAWALYEGLGFQPIRRLEIVRGAATLDSDATNLTRCWSSDAPWLV